VMLILLTAWRKRDSFKTFSKLSNYGIIFAGLVLFMMQMHGYSHMSNPDEFAFSRDNHLHEHLQMNSEAAKKQIEETSHESLF